MSHACQLPTCSRRSCASLTASCRHVLMRSPSEEMQGRLVHQCACLRSESPCAELLVSSSFVFAQWRDAQAVYQQSRCHSGVEGSNPRIRTSPTNGDSLRWEPVHVNPSVLCGSAQACSKRCPVICNRRFLATPHRRYYDISLIETESLSRKEGSFFLSCKSSCITL
jgi:hypothetical protein